MVMTQSPLFSPVQREDAEALAYFQDLRTAFEQAATSVGGVQSQDYLIGGLYIRLRFAGGTLVKQMTPALAHLATPAVERPDLTVHLWDSASTGVMTPSPPWRDDPYAYGSHGEVRGYSGDRIRIVFNMFFDALSILNVEQNEAIFWVRDEQKIPFWETAAPLRIILHWWLGSRGLQYIHAAAVGTATAGALLVGKGGSGKSTTALTCLDSDLLYVSDDYCLLKTEPDVRAYSLYSSAKLKPDNTRLPHLLPLIHNQNRQPDEKPFILLQPHFPSKLVPSLPIDVILVPQVTGRVDTRVSPASAAKALLALAPSTIFQLPGGNSAKFQNLAALVKQIPCYTLELGTDLSQIPKTIADLLEEVAPCSP
jgi:hypothetical protein